jgi:DNA-binding winged helix-turn-helix (wHTH) protein/TolB-like protein/tetratricopeptide (TPR) repeat protein
MDTLAPADSFLFEGFRLDRGGGGLFRRDERGSFVPVSIGSRALDILGCLLERPGTLVSKDVIVDAVWPGLAVEPNNLTVQISALRRILDPAGSRTSCIQTVPGRGYRFVGPVTRLAAPTGVPDASASEDVPSPPGVIAEAAAPKRRFTAAAIGAGVVVLLATLAAGFGWMLHDQVPPRPAAYSPQDRRQSVIVLPFENSSGDPAQDSVAAGVTRDVTYRIVQDQTVPIVPAANDAAYRGKALDLRAIGRDHDVYFVLTGNAHRLDGRLIVAATLYQIYDERPVWSKQFDRPDRPDEWSRITHEIANGFAVSTIDAEAARAMREHPNDLDKRDLMFAASGTSLSSQTKENDLARIALMDRALALDPNYLWALRMDARMHADLVGNGFSSDRDADVAYAMKLLDRALQVAPNDVETLAQKSAILLRTGGSMEEAEALVRKVIELRPMWGFRYNDLGIILMIKGHHKEALENFMKAKQLAAGDDSVAAIDSNLAFALLANDRFPEAIAQAHLAIPEFSAAEGMGAEFPWLALIAAESASGQDAEAHADLQTFLATARTWRTIAAIQKRPSFAANPKLLDGLRRAGMPEQ